MNRSDRWFARRSVALRVALLVLVLAYATYLLVANIALSTSLISKTVASSGVLKVDYASARTWWPGSATVRDIRVFIDDRNVQAMLQMSEAKLHVSLWDLAFRRTFHVTKIRAQEARFFMRHKLAVVDAHSARRVAAFPDIPGFDPVPLFDSEAPRPEQGALSTREKKLWTIHIEDVESSVRELWFQEYRYRGNGFVRGAFRLQPMKTLAVGPATLELEPGTLTAFPATLAEEIGGKVEVRVHEFDVLEHKGAKALGFVDARATVDAKIPDIGVMSLYMQSPQFAGGKGRLRGDVRFDRGTLAVPTEANLDLADVSLRFGERLVSGTTSLSLKASERGKFMVGFDAASISLAYAAPSAAAKSIGKISGATARVTLDSPTLAEGAHITSGNVKARADIDDLAALVAADALREGSAAGTLDATFEGDRFNATMAAEAKKLSFDIGDKVKAGADFSVKGRASGDRDFEVVVFEDVRVDAPRFAARGAGPSRATWVSARIGKAVIAGDPSCAAFPVDANAGSASILGAFMDVGPLEPVAAEVLKGAAMKARGRVQIGSGGFQMHLDQAKVGETEAHGVYVKGKGKNASTGAFLIDHGVLQAGIDLRGGDVKVKPLASLDWLEERARVIAGGGPPCKAAASRLAP
jgi:hypothetical protein